MSKVYLVVVGYGTAEEPILGAFDTRELADEYAKTQAQHYPDNEAPYVYEMPLLSKSFYS